MKKKPHTEEKYTYIYKASKLPIGEKSFGGTKICAIR